MQPASRGDMMGETKKNPAAVRSPAGQKGDIMAEEMNKENTQQDEMTEEGGNRRRIAVVTGASSGLGRQFVRMLDRAGEVDEIWVVARRRYRLEELQDVVDTPLKMLAYDLTDRQAVRDIQGMLSDEDPDVRWLINCAGMGKIGSIETISMEDNETMIDLNCRAAVTMTQACVPYMEEGARIMNICSAAGFQPLPYLNVYAATKAFMIRFSRALGRELKVHRISVTAVCPYWVSDTEFIQMAKKTGNSEYIHSFPLSSQEKYVAHRAFRDTQRRKAVSTPSVFATVERVLAKLFPSGAAMSIWDVVRKL